MKLADSDFWHTAVFCLGVKPDRPPASAIAGDDGESGRRKDPVVPPAVLHAVLTVPSGLAGRPPAGTLAAACEPDPGIACRLIWDISHSTSAAGLTKVFFAGPAQVVARIAFVLLIAVVLRIAAHRLIGRITARAIENAASRADRASPVFSERRNPRASALGSVLRNAASVTIFGIAAAIILGDMGVNLAPVLASAGVLGIALGFGAQNLVQDFLSGIFMLLEDQYGVGDVVAVGDVTGTVEAVSLRVTRVRDLNGVVWHIRNGTISQAGNESQGWARAIVDFPVSYDRDIPHVRQLMMHTAAGMWQEPDWHGVMLEEPEVWGVQAVSTDEVVLRLAARTAPLRQWEVARELRERLKTALDAAGGDENAAMAGSEARDSGQAHDGPDDADGPAVP
jgi:small conductance mechanosensitive channel